MPLCSGIGDLNGRRDQQRRRRRGFFHPHNQKGLTKRHWIFIWRNPVSRDFHQRLLFDPAVKVEITLWGIVRPCLQIYFYPINFSAL